MDDRLLVAEGTTRDGEEYNILFMQELEVDGIYYSRNNSGNCIDRMVSVKIDTEHQMYVSEDAWVFSEGIEVDESLWMKYGDECDSNERHVSDQIKNLGLDTWYE